MHLCLWLYRKVIREGRATWGSGCGVCTLRVTWRSTFRRRTDLERRSPRARVRGECTQPRARSPCLPPHNRKPRNYSPRSYLRLHGTDDPTVAGLAVTIPASITHPSRTGTSATRHTFPIKYNRQVYWHRVSPTIAQMLRFFNYSTTVVIFVRIRKHFVLIYNCLFT